MAFTAKILSWRFLPPEYCRLFAQKKAYQGGFTGTPGPPLATPLQKHNLIREMKGFKSDEKHK